MFRLCAIAGIGAGLGGIAWTGIDAAELRAALALRRVPRAHWSELADDVHFMDAPVAHERNRCAERESERRG